MARRRRPEESVDGYDVPPELLNPHHALWHDRDRYLEYMHERGWRPGAADRFGGSTSPANRRRNAAGGWARDNGIVAASHPDWHKLRAMGLIA